MKIQFCIFFLLTIILIFFNNTAHSQKNETLPDSTLVQSSENEKRGYFRIMFYNCENYYDVLDDPKTSDETFTPEGMNHWTPDKYWEKARNLAKVIVAVGGWDPPAIVGFCEVENLKVLEDLVKNTPLSQLNYSIIHYDSKDARGIDVALIYRKEDFKPLFSKPLQLNFPEGKVSRDILYVKGITSKNDTLHVFVNHWPSKYGGEMASEPRRLFAGEFLRKVTDSIFTTNANANIIIIGDLNDGPENNSVSEALKARTKYDYLMSSYLYNMSYYLHYKKGVGTHKYQGEWNLIDNIIVSGALLNEQNSVFTTLDDAHVFNASFLLEKDERDFGYKPFRTYMGMTYTGGFSDHLPIFLDLRKNVKK